MAAREWKIWQEYYLPNFSIRGKTVMDVGSGSGETAHFYFLNGARKLIAIEPDGSACAMLRENARRNHWDIDIIEREFALEDLDRPHDFMKMDCEGCESLLLSNKIRDLQPCVIETHDLLTSSFLQRKFQLDLLLRVTDDVRILARRQVGPANRNQGGQGQQL
jgi:SAM-dependent methyltransferase